ncbi:SAM-dependent methyltransferase (plasmid) [Nocardiopsis exhalans]|uniref:SAM-dependent methyltransferase n=1 Tax=Nocardiopsis exhalans TaxID=163604 RepID=A0ABY5DJD3_9ACTN|nr:SAM-dependent methyltransferase [Nocardiopsis exhalans]USY23590.1 SAM-dependent methyltransferase [Nocardiopsis exhalans]
MTSARVHDYLSAGKDNFAADRQVAEKMLTADPAQLAMVDASRSRIRQAVVEMATSGIDQFADLGCGLPRMDQRGLHDLVQTITPGAAVVYIDHDLHAAVTTRAHYRHEVVSVVDGDLRDPTKLLSDPEIVARLDLRRPIGLVCALTLPHLLDDEVTALCAALAAVVPPRSQMVITHPSGAHAQAAADAYRHGTAEHGAEDFAVARSPYVLESLLEGWSATTTSEAVGPLSDLLTVTATRT